MELPARKRVRVARTQLPFPVLEDRREDAADDESDLLVVVAMGRKRRARFDPPELHRRSGPRREVSQLNALDDLVELPIGFGNVLHESP